MPNAPVTTVWARQPASLARLRAEVARRPGRWRRRAFVLALVALIVGALGSAVGTVAVEDIAATVALVALAAGSVMGLCRPGSDA